MNLAKVDIITNARKDASVQRQEKWYQEIDIWIPSLNLGLEFQVESHLHQPSFSSAH